MAKRIFRSSLLVFLVLALMLCFPLSASPMQKSSVPCFDGVSGFNMYPVSKMGAYRGGTVDCQGMQLYVGGMPFGVKFLTDGVIIAGMFDVKTQNGSINPAAKAGLKQNDIIVKINGTNITDAALLTELTEKSQGKPLEVTYSRDGKSAKTTLTPALCSDDGKYKSGMYVRDSGAGIGTVTYITPDTLSFGGLGHGICDGQSGKLIPMQRGSVVGVTISGVVKGLSGAPGEVRGYFSSGKTGTLLQNTDCGVFGVLATLPSNADMTLMPVAPRSEIRAGEAYILSTLDGTAPQKYTVQISDIKQGSMTNKCFTVKVTDPALLERSGGIVQGMSGSPIIQNGKLVGAVTHVLINDPTTGYGIFIENMLAAAQVPMQRAA